MKVSTSKALCHVEENDDETGDVFNLNIPMSCSGVQSSDQSGFQPNESYVM